MGKDRSEPENREIYQVKDRYFMPINVDENSNEHIYIGLVVDVRPRREDERAVIRT